MKPRYTIMLAQPDHVEGLRAIELEAATLLVGHAPRSVLEVAKDPDELRRAQQAGRLWVALADDRPVGFALVEMLGSDLPHLEEIDVAPSHGRRGLGTSLLRAVCNWVQQAGYRELTLSTFRTVPWNMPFYTRFGFEEIPAGELRPELAEVIRGETARGLDPVKRTVMRYRVQG